MTAISGGARSRFTRATNDTHALGTLKPVRTHYTRYYLLKILLDETTLIITRETFL